MKVTNIKEAEDWFKNNPGRNVTVEHGENSVNCANLDEARLVLEPNKLEKPKKEKKDK